MKEKIRSASDGDFIIEKLVFDFGTHMESQKYFVGFVRQGDSKICLKYIFFKKLTSYWYIQKINLSITSHTQTS